MAVKIVGADLGNTETTIVFTAGNRKRIETMSSDIGSGSLDELARLRGGARAERSLDEGEHVLEYRGRSYFVGELAVQQSNDSSTGRGDVTRYWKGHTLRLLLAAVGAATKGDQHIRVVTGLPVETWSRETAGLVRASLVGTHAFRLDGESRSITVEGVLTVMEGAGATSIYEPTGADQAVLDIGGRTTDIFVGDARLRPIMPRCGNIAVGVGTIGDLLSQDFERRYGRPLKAGEVRNLLRSYANPQKTPRDPIFAGGRRVEGDVDVGAVAETVGQQIASFVARKLKTSERGSVGDDLSRMLLIGGGAFYPGIVDRIREIAPTIEIARKPATANAEGYCATGEAVPEEMWAKFAA